MSNPHSGVAEPRSPPSGSVEPEEISLAPGPWRKIAAFLVVSICTLTFMLTVVEMSASLLAHQSAGRRDFVEYWASAQLLAHRANPYDGDAILRLERSVGYPRNFPVLIMWNLPPALPFVLPLGFLGPQTAELLWITMLLGSLLASVRLIWIMHGRPENNLALLGYLFAPALACLGAGQLSLFILLGLVLFLRLHRRRPFLAGVCLWLCMLKPHLFLPFGVVLLAWAILNRSYRLLLGAAFALGTSTAFAFLADPLIFTHYRRMVKAAQIGSDIPSLSILLRQSISSGTIWLQYLPAVLGCAWALAYFRRHRGEWDWTEHGSLLMLVSVLVAPYSWFTDQAILIPALLHAAYSTRSRVLIAMLALASAVIEMGILYGAPILHSQFYLWTAPAWLGWYLYVTRAGNAADAVNFFSPTDGIKRTFSPSSSRE